MLGSEKGYRATFRCYECGTIVTMPGTQETADKWLSKVWMSEAKRHCEACKQACKHDLCPWWGGSEVQK